MEGKSTQEILEEGNRYAKEIDVMKHGVFLEE